jgi:hypothetical protein
MAEWFKAHAWKACVGKTTVGSNPTLSATFLPAIKLVCRSKDSDQDKRKVMN